MKSQLNWVMKIINQIKLLIHHPSSQNHIINWRDEIRYQNKRNFDPTNHHKLPKHDYLINEMEL